MSNLDGKELSGRVRINRVNCFSGDDEIWITVEDEISGVSFLKMKLSISEAGNLFTNRSTDCEIAYRGMEKIGKVREIKHEEVFVKDGSYEPNHRKVRAKVALKPFEIDGWKGSVNDATNHHCIIKHGEDGDHYRVVFTRFVERSDNESN